MYKPLIVLLTPFCIHGSPCKAQAQNSSTAVPAPARVVVGTPAVVDSDCIVIPAATSWTATVASGKPASPQSDLSSWVVQRDTQNGLQGLNSAWHIVITYEQFGKDGSRTHNGTYEELWAGPKRYKVSYKADDLNQTDYATANGLYRLGDQQWPNRTQTQVSREVLDPFFYAGTLRDVTIRDLSQKFGDHALRCAVIEGGPGRIINPTQYCFDPNGSSLRYSRGEGWLQTTYNDLTVFSGRSVARTIDVYDSGKPYLALHVQRLESMASVQEEDFAPPPEAKLLSGEVLSGVNPVSIQRAVPEWPGSLKRQHFLVVVERLIGKDGHVKNAHAVSGPPDAFKSAEATALKWTFQPYLVLNQPAEVMTKISLSNF